MMPLLKVVLLALAFTVVGRRLLRITRFDLEAGEELGFSFVVGAGLMGLLILTIGMLGFLRPWIAYGLLLVPLALCPEDLRIVLIRVWGGARQLKYPQTPRVARLALVVLLMNVAINGFAALAPPTGTDTLSARLAIPKAYVEAGKIIYLPSNLHANLPGNVEMLYTLGMLLGSDVVAQLLHLCFGLFLLLGIYCLAARYFSPSLAALSCLLFYSLTDVVAQFSAAYTDLAVSAFALYAFAAWVRWWELNEPRWLLLAGILAGAAAGSKLNALGALGALLLMTGMVSWRVRKNKIRQILSDVLWVSLPGMAVFSPWLVKNLALTGNPLYPLFAGVLGGRGITPEESALFFSNAMRNSAIRRSTSALVTLPWDATMFGPYTSGTIGPLFLMVLPFLPWLRPKPLLFRPIGWFALPFAALWYWGSPFVRFAFVLLALLSVVTVWGFETLSRQSKYARAVCIIFASLWFTAATGNNVRVHEATFPLELGLESREEYLRRVLPIRGDSRYFEDFQWMNVHLAPGARVLSWTWSNYYLERPWIFVGRLHAYTDTHGVESPEAFLKLLERVRVSYVFLVDGLEDGPYCPVPRASEFVHQLAGSGALREIWQHAGVHVYQLREKHASYATICRKRPVRPS